MLESSNLVSFAGLANSSGYDTFLLDEERGRLLVGAEDHIFSFDLVNISRDRKQVPDDGFCYFFGEAGTDYGNSIHFDGGRCFEL